MEINTILGLLFGVFQFWKVKKLKAHQSMLDVAQVIYETCKTYLLTQGKFLLILELFIGAIISLNSVMGPDLSLFAFFVVVLAGMGYLPGVPWASFLLGLIQSFFLICISSNDSNF